MTQAALSSAEQWADALVEWLGITEDQIHVTNCGRDTDLTGRSFKVWISCTRCSLPVLIWTQEHSATVHLHTQSILLMTTTRTMDQGYQTCSQREQQLTQHHESC